MPYIGHTVNPSKNVYNPNTAELKLKPKIFMRSCKNAVHVIKPRGASNQTF